MKTILFAITILLASCSKQSNEPSAQDEQIAADLNAYLPGKAYRLQSYHADRPIDYYNWDTVGLTTDLWQFVPWEIQDDSTFFNADGSLDIYQNANVIPSNTDPLIKRTWKVWADSKGVHMDYISHTYSLLQYNYLDRTDSTMTIEIAWNTDKSVQLITTMKLLK